MLWTQASVRARVMGEPLPIGHVRRPRRKASSGPGKAGPDPDAIARDYLLTASLSPLPAANFGTLRAGMSTSAPVEGLRPFEAAR